MSFICIEYIPSATSCVSVLEVIVSSVKDAFITGSIFDNSSDVVAWRIKDLKGGLKYNYGWAPESEWKKYKQSFFISESETSEINFGKTIKVTFKPDGYIKKSQPSINPQTV